MLMDAPRTAMGEVLINVTGASNAPVDLVCFSHAGAGPAMYRDWAQGLEGCVNVLAVQLPGRERRWLEKPLTEANEAARQIGAALAAYRNTRPTARLAFFGHSLGALLAFETARWLETQYGAGPEVLFVAGRRAPNLPLNRPCFHTLDDAEFLERIDALGGTPPGILSDKRLARMILPTLRADVAMTDGYTCRDARPTNARGVALYGREDQIATQAETEAWRPFAPVDSFQCVAFEGGHFFVKSAREAVLDLLRVTLGAP